MMGNSVRFSLLAIIIVLYEILINLISMTITVYNTFTGTGNNELQGTFRTDYKQMAVEVHVSNYNLSLLTLNILR